MARRNSAKMKKTATNTLVHVILSILAVIWVLPIVYVIMISFRGEEGSYPLTLIPTQWTLSNYTRLFSETDMYNFPRWFANTFIVSIFTCIISTFFLVSIAFTMSRLRFKMRKKFMNIAFVVGMFPGFMSMIAVYYILKGIGIIDGALKLVALVIVYSGGSGILNFYVAKGFFDTIPKSIDEAAYVDGATKWNSFTKIILPLSKPIVLYTVLTSFMAPWLDFIFAKVIVGAESKYYTVAIGLFNMLEKENVWNWYNRFFAGAVIISIPIAILFIIMQRFYTDGMSGAVKG